MVLGGWVLTYIVNLIGGGLDVSHNLWVPSHEGFFCRTHPQPAAFGAFLHAFVCAGQLLDLTKGVIGGIEKAAKFFDAAAVCFPDFYGDPQRDPARRGKGHPLLFAAGFQQNHAQLFVLCWGRCFSRSAWASA